MMHGDEKDVLVVSDLREHDPKERSRREIEGSASFVWATARARPRAPPPGWPQVDSPHWKRNFRTDPLERASAFGSESGAQYFVAAHDLRETPIEHRCIHRPRSRTAVGML